MRHEAGDQVEELAEEDGGLDREHGVPRHDHLDTGHYDNADYRVFHNNRPKVVVLRSKIKNPCNFLGLWTANQILSIR